MILNNHIFKSLDNDSSDEHCNIFINELMTIYNSEKELNETLPTMIKNAKTSEIVTALTKHLRFTQEHLLRLETFFKSINQPLIS
ncbi:DUF892 family protein [Flavobacterium sp.]|jgi:ferritin-like metal-binding protein YciE|uniref:DUF892 family protein n=1 Tax=Flavobacterium sp. TaxID=239 RepID=UPI00374CA843